MSSGDNKKISIRIAAGIGGVAIGALVALVVHPAELSFSASATLGILAGAIVWWVAGVFSEVATALLMAVLFILIAGIDSSTVFSCFSETTWWILVGAFALGAGMKSTGLLRRMALAIVSKFPHSFKAQAAGFILAGTVLGPLIPSAAAKVSLLAPLAMGVGDKLGYERQGKRMTGLFLAMFTGVENIVPAVISASIIGFALLALCPADVQAQFDYLTWFLTALPWFVVLTVLNYIGICVMYGKEKGEKGKAAKHGASADDVNEAGRLEPVGTAADPIAEQRAALGPLSRAEKLMAVIIGLTVLAWVTQSLHGVPAYAVTIIALFALFACNVIGQSDFAGGINWSSLVFIGIVLGLGGVFAESGLDQWIVDSFTPLLTALSQNSYLFVLGVALITIVCRLVIVSQIAFTNIFMAFAVPLAVSLGINPWVVGMATITVLSMWYVKYQNPIYLAAFYSVDGQMAKHSECAKYCVVYTVFCLIALMISVPIWQAMGLFS